MASRYARDEQVRILFRAPNAEPRRAAIFLDRDGVINRRVHPGYVAHWSQFKYARGIKSALKRLAKLGLPMIVVSNQAGLAKGAIRRAELESMTARFVADLGRAGVRIAAVYYCPHTAENGCACRKPQTGLLRRAAGDWNLDVSRSVLIGDSESDVQAARRAHCGAVLLGNVDAAHKLSGSRLRVVRRYADLAASVEQLLNSDNQ